MGQRETSVALEHLKLPWPRFRYLDQLSKFQNLLFEHPQVLSRVAVKSLVFSSLQLKGSLLRTEHLGTWALHGDGYKLSLNGHQFQYPCYLTMAP